MKIKIEFETEGSRGLAKVIATYSDGVSRVLINDRVGKRDYFHKEDLELRVGDFIAWFANTMTEYYNLTK